jgi:hypothetical protein
MGNRYIHFPFCSFKICDSIDECFGNGVDYCNCTIVDCDALALVLKRIDDVKS